MATKIKLSARWYSLIIFLVILILWLVQTKTIHESWNESTRLAAIQSLVERGTWRIDASPYGHETGDKVLLDGHYYSDKPPLFAAIGAIPYAAIYYGLGAALAIDGCLPGDFCVYYWLTVLLVGMPSALMAALFYKLVFRQLSSNAWALGLTLLLCFGTAVWPYSLVFNHHLPAAVALFISFYLLFDLCPNHLKLMSAGCLAGVAVMLDLTSVFLALALLLIVMIYYRRGIFPFGVAALIPGIVTIIFNYQITGGLLLPYFSGEGYGYPGSPFDITVGGQHAPDNVLLHTFRNIAGDHGLFVYSPLLIFATIGLVYIATKKNPLLSVKSALILLGITGHFLFVWTRTNNFGGDAYGGRFFIPVIPILYFFMVFVVPVRFYKPGGKWVAALWGVAVVVSVFSAYQGVRATWHQIHPPFFINLRANIPYLAVKTNLSLPGSQPITRNNDGPTHNFQMPNMSHRLEANFNNEVVLLGYDLPARRVEPGLDLELTLYWQLLRVVLDDYFIFTHLLDEKQFRQGGLDRQLQEEYPIKLWYPGEIVTDQVKIPVGAETGPGLLWLRLGLYQPTAAGFAALPLVVDGHQSEETSIVLGPVLVGVPAQVIDRRQLSPDNLLNVKLGQPPVILLHGYNMNRQNDSIQLTLYWESLTPTPVDWMTFVHLKNETGEIVAQQDNQTGGGFFPTSLWEVGEMVADPVSLRVPPRMAAGQYTLVTGLYRLDTGQRLKVPASEDDSVELITINLGE